MRSAPAAIVAFAGAVTVCACLLTLPLDELERDRGLSDSGAEADALAETADDAAEETGPATCKNKALDGDETDVDCGGACNRCAAGKRCRRGEDCESGTCEGTTCAACPPGMARVPAGAGYYCIDTTEVTVAEYGAFALATKPADVRLHPACSGKIAFNPPTVGDGENLPARNLDWCDAFQYCRARDKRLCGQIGPRSQPTPDSGLDDPNTSQWRHACSFAVSPVWPYGVDAAGSACNTGGSDNTVAPVRSKPNCVGNAPELKGVYDMSGNVAEWEDGCNGENCPARGGAYNDRANAASCAATAFFARRAVLTTVGFRCCKF
jgi:hypothetical protein